MPKMKKNTTKFNANPNLIPSSFSPKYPSRSTNRETNGNTSLRDKLVEDSFVALREDAQIHRVTEKELLAALVTPTEKDAIRIWESFVYSETIVSSCLLH